MALLIACHSKLAWGQSTHNLHPIMVSSKGGQIDSATRNLMVATFSEAIRESSLKSLGQQFYGTSATSGFSGTSQAGPISMLRKTLLNFDMIMGEKVRQIHSRLKAPSTDAADNQLEFFWTSRTIGSKVLPVNGSLFGMLFKILTPSQKSGVKIENPFAIQIGSQLIAMEAAREQDVPGGTKSLADESKRAYSTLRNLNPGVWMPLYFKAGISINRDKTIISDFSVSMIPIGFTMPKDTMNDLSIDSVVYNPRMDYADVLHIRFQRAYEASNTPNSPAILKVNFGPLNTEDMASTVCTGDSCIERVDSIPTVNATMTGSWFKKAFASALSLNNFKMMIASLGIKLTSLEVDPDSSELPVMVKTYTFGWKIIDTKRNIRPLNPLEAIQKSLIGDRASEGISEMIQPASEKAEKSMNNAVKTVIQLFN